MDFIERWFAVSPDGGNGQLEIMLIAALLAAMATPLLVGRLRSAVRRTRRASER